MLGTYLGQGIRSVFVKIFWLKVSTSQLEQANVKDRIYWEDTDVAYRILKTGEEGWVGSL